MRILILEDEAPDRSYHERLARQAMPEAEIVGAETLESGLAAVREQTFDLAILDLDLHGDREAGQQVLAALRERGSTPVVVISGLDVGIFRPKLFASDVWDYFQKPVDGESLRLVIQRFLAPRRASAVAPAICVGELEWHDPPTAKPRWKSNVVHLSFGERQVLRLLTQTPEKLVKYATLFDLSERWDRDSNKLKGALATRISGIRSAFLSLDPEFDSIITIANQGYMWSSEAR